jgi:hypothetical protein
VEGTLLAAIDALFRRTMAISGGEVLAMDELDAGASAGGKAFKGLGVFTSSLSTSSPPSSTSGRGT